MERLVLLLICSLSIWGAGVAQPANNDCGAATEITPANLDDSNGGCVTLIGEDNTGSTPWSVPPNFVGNCWNGIDTLNTVFYFFEAQGVSVEIDVQNGPGDYYISLIEFTATGCDGTNITEWGCGANQPIVLDNDLTIGTFYYVIVSFAENLEGTFDLCVFNPVSAPNDECVNAIELTSIDGTPCNTGLNNYYPSTETPLPGCFPANATQGVWYYFTAQGVSIADLHIDNAPGVANVAVWDFDGATACDLPNGVVLACRTDVDINNPIELDNALTIGQNYYIQVTFDDNVTGDFDICLDAPEQAFNDDCINAAIYPTDELDEENNCITVIGPDQLNNDWPSTDVLIPGCWDPDFTYSVWFQFTAQGPDVDIEVDLGGADEQIALLEYQAGNVCDVAGAALLECSTGQDLEVDNALNIGSVYYVMVGFDNNEVGDYCINIFNPIPPDNDTVCSALPLMTDGSCNSGPPCINDCYTTEYANPEFNPQGFPAQCQPFLENTVWFTAQLTDPNNVGLEINLEEGTGENFTMVIGTFNDCNGQFFVEDFFCDFDYPIEFGPIYDETQVYYIMVGTAEDDEGTFDICVDEIEPCFENNFCEDQVGTSNAEEIVGVVTNDGFVCVDGCSFWADPNTESNACGQDQGPTVWYTITTDAEAAVMNIIVESDEFDAPTIVLYNGSCNGGLATVPVNDGQGCATGSGGQAIANTNVQPNEQYFISVSGVNTEGGDFELCINTLFEASACVLSSSQEIVSRSFGGPLEGPFFPGEEVTLCFTVQSYTTAGNNCQWFQGVVPVFGNGWDLTTFDPQGGSTLNGANYPTGGIYGGTWDWYDDVEYNSDIAWLNVGPFGNEGSLGLCNAFFNPNCTGPGISGGTANGNCTVGGDVLPPGWFVTNPIDGCAQSGHPDDDWGDGSGCGGTNGPWEFCMDLRTKDFPDCDSDPSSSDLTVTFFTFADGEVGAWNGGPSTCAADQPETFIYPMCCTETDVLPGENIEFCTPGTFSYLLDNPNVDFWEWTVDVPPGVFGPTDGSGPNGTNIVSTIENTGSSAEFVTYNFAGFAGGDCPAATLQINVLVYPELTVEMTPFRACATPNNPYELIPTVSGGDPGSYMYAWNNGSTDPTLEIDMPEVGQPYTVTVTDAAGCEGTASVVLDVYETFPVDIDAPNTSQCFTDGAIILNADATDGTPAYDFEWTSPMGSNASGSSVSALEEGQWLVEATDSEGCVGSDSVTLDFFESPDIAISPDPVSVCPDNPNPEQIIAITTGGQPPYQYSWSTPAGVFSTGFIFADVIGNYSISVTDFNGCTAELDFTVDEAPSPMVDLGPDVSLCEEDLALGYTIDVPFDPSYAFYEWSTGSLNSSIDVNQPGTYQLTVTNTGGCIGTAQIEILTYDPVDDQFPDSVAFCEGGFAIIEANDASLDYDWSTGGNGPLIFAFDEGEIFVTVTDVTGCTAEESIYVEEAEFLAPDIIGDSVICNGVPVDIVANAGFDTYEWSDGTIDEQTITVTSGGWYFLTVSDGDGCFGFDSVFVVESAPAPSISGDPAICSGEQAQLQVDMFATIEWSTGETTQTITTDTAGMFTVTVTDQFGCSNDAQFQVAEEDTPEPNIAGSTSFCTGNSTTLDAGPGFSTYEWSTGETSQTISVNTTSTVFLTVTNTGGCEGFDTLSVTESSALTPQIMGNDILCGGGSETLDAGTGFTGYSWSTGETTQTISVSAANTYTVTVTDASGCTGTDQITVQASDPMPAITGNNSACAGASEILTADAGFATYAWSTGESTQAITVNAAGTYEVTVTDALGCTGTATLDFAIDPLPSVNIAGSTTYCVGGSTELDAGAGYTTYAWSTGGSTQFETISSPGQVSVTVTDANGCTGIDQVDVTESTELQLNVQDTALCTGEVVTLVVGNFASYAWSTTETTSTIDVNTGGTYGVTVTDVTGCTGSSEINVTENAPPTATVTPTADVCNTSSDGSTLDFTALITAGDASGSWTDVDNSGASGTLPNLDFDGIAPGQYTFEYTTATAVSPCTDQTYTVVVTVLDCACPSPQINTPAPLCADNGVLDLESLFISGVTQPGGSWTIVSDPAGSNPATLNGSVFDATGADAGIYEIQYTIQGIPAGCPDNDIQQVEVFAPVFAGNPSGPAQVCVNTDSTIILSNLLDGQEMTGIWVETSITMSQAGFDPAAGTFNTAIEMPGTYTFQYTVSATAPCQDDAVTVEVVVEDEPFADAGADGLITCDEPVATLDGTGSSTGAVFEYNWYYEGNLLTSGTPTTQANDAGSYELEVVNTQTGCRASDFVEVSIDGDVPVLATPAVVSPLCVGDGSASVTPAGVMGGSGPFTYTLNGADQTSDGIYTDLAPGDYTLEVTDANGCRDAFNFSIEQPTEIDGVIEGNFVVSAGEETVLGYVVTSGVADSAVWFDGDGLLLCDGCDSLVIAPTVNMDVFLTLFDENKCSVQLATELRIVTDREVFVPNVFSPNDDGVNDFVTIYGDPGTQVTLFEVFSRWGELLYRNDDGFLVNSNSPDDGWNGFYRGESMQPGVYVFHATVVFPDGFEENVRGDITLIK